MEKQIIAEITQLEIKAWIYADMLGNDAEEVKAIDKKIKELNLQLLDIMCPEEKGA